MKTITQTFYGDISDIISELDIMKVKYTVRDVLNRFWGKEIMVIPPIGRDSRTRINKIYDLLEK